MQKKTNLYFRWAAIFFLVSFAFTFLSNFIHYMYYQYQGGSVSFMEYIGGASWFVTTIIGPCLFSGFLVLGLFLQKRWAVVTGLILQLLPLLYSTYSKLHIYSIVSRWASYHQILNYIIFPLADLLLLGGFYALLLVRLFRKKPFHPTLASITLLLPIANFLIFCIVACFLNYTIPPVAFLQNLLSVLPLLFIGAGFFPPRRQAARRDRTLSLCGFWSLVIGLTFGVCICVVSIAIYDEIYVYYGYEYTKWMWWAVNALMFFGAVTAPGLLRFWHKANRTAEKPQPILPPMPPMPSRQQYAPQSYAPYPPVRPVQYAPPAQPTAPVQSVQYAPSAQPVQRPVTPVTPVAPVAPPTNPVATPTAPVAPPVQPVAPVTPVAPPATQTPPNDLTTQLRMLKQIQDEGLISQEDYDAKKKQLLGL